MKQFEKLSHPAEMDFYQIFEVNGVKHIHVFGYCYKNDDHWTNIEFTGFIEPLSEFIKNVDVDSDYVDEKSCDIKQFWNDFSEDEMLDAINHYFSGQPAQYAASYSDLTMDSPCGDYVVYDERSE